jgi:hypothetical protein
VGVAKAPIRMSCRPRIFETLASLDAGSGLVTMPLSWCSPGMSAVKQFKRYFWSGCAPVCNGIVSVAGRVV